MRGRVDLFLIPGSVFKIFSSFGEGRKYSTLPTPYKITKKNINQKKRFTGAFGIVFEPLGHVF